MVPLHIPQITEESGSRDETCTLYCGYLIIYIDEGGLKYLFNCKQDVRTVPHRESAEVTTYRKRHLAASFICTLRHLRSYPVFAA
jgi:hypothetical protein